MESVNTQAGARARRRAGRHAVTALGASAVLAFGLFAPAAAQAATAGTLYVSQGGLDSGSCPVASPCATVSYALTKAASGATIKVSGTINDHLSITSPVTITTWPGGPAGSPGVLNGTATGTVVTVDPGVTSVTVQDMTIENGALGILDEEGTLTLTDSTVTGNATVAEPYAGIWNYADSTMTIIDSTVTKNSGAPGGSGVGAGIDNNGVLTVVASTISGNSGGGIYSGQLDTATLGATIVAGNTGTNCDGYDPASLASAGYNLTDDKTGTACGFTAATDLVNQKPALGALAGNGGPTQTMLPAAKSPAANVVPKAVTLRGVKVCPATDQRGVARPGHGETRCTIGAAEVSFSKPTTTSVTVNPATVASGTRVVYLAVVSPKSGTGTPTGTITFSTGSTTLCTAVLSGGVAACGATNAPAGTDTVTGKYSGGQGYVSSSGTAKLTVT
ncbi:MAG TPA: right-handed parallel beta-helix repeat-containing protein [Streptosporangiaceae bacterium]|jgi:hypothetical protein